MSHDFAPPPSLGEPTHRDSPASSRQMRPPSRRQPRGRSPRMGMWFAIVTATVLVLGLGYAVWLEFEAGRLGPIDRSFTGSAAAMQVVEGVCLADAVGRDGPVGTVSVVDCNEPHHSEVVASVHFSQEQWPGFQHVRSRAMERCTAVMTPGGGILDEDPTTMDLRWVVWNPTPETWNRNHRDSVCVVSRDEPWTGSLFSGTADL